MSSSAVDQQLSSNDTDASSETLSNTNEATTPTTTTEKVESGKVMILFQAVGSAPILKKKKYTIGAASSFNTVIAFLRDKLLRITNPNQTLFLYCGQAFCPNPDDYVGDLFDHFNTNGMLVINYSLKIAWG
ncbi:autophagy protein 12 [Naegleria gruberi]|uniref:Ubiquitin-like protein ATG12 n=1 Tax=Naegleria gruberi TaxID=5762 RepID=D2VXP7_NAEGR|nr:autophagy protein 12 [Naegleria gruberi]EFC38375.1 autophagy protein 12 [Naegleria gruberi]|eukprot:XP_002671119.1 autophagy protein 12 [Naegleria gruberi strain NEG-M]